MKTKEERNQQAQEALEKINKGVEAFLNSNKYKEMLKEISKFRKYSFGNRILILMQNPDASHVNSFTRWKALGRHVKAGEKSLKILAPNTYKKQMTVQRVDMFGNIVEDVIEKTYLSGFKTTNVFDISQTEGAELAIDKICENLEGSVKNFEKYLEAAQAVVPVPIRIEKGKTGSTTKGYCTPSEIVIYENPELQMFKTLLHEMGHVLLNHTDMKCDIDRDEKERQAESVAYIVASNLGYDTSDYSFEYIGMWSDSENNIEKTKKSLEEIVKATEIILNGFDKIKEAKAQSFVFCCLIFCFFISCQAYISMR